MLQRQHKVDDDHHDMPLVYYMEGHTLDFGHREFSLITSFCFVTDEETFGKLSDEDAVRPWLLLALEVIFMGRLLTLKVDDTLFRHNDEFYYGFKKDRNFVPTYTFSGFVFAFQESRSTSELQPTTTEYKSSWWIHNNVYFQVHVPRAHPMREQHRLFKTYLSKLEKARKRENTGFMVSSIGGTTDNSVRKKWLNDLVIIELNFRVFKLETIIQVLANERNDRQAKLQFNDEFSSMTSDLCDSLNSIFVDLIQQHDSDEDIAQDYLQEEELRLCLEDEERLRCEHEKLIVQENRFRLEEANRLRLEEENMLQLAEQKKKKRKEFMNSSHAKNILAKLAPAKRNQVGSCSEKINSKVSWVKIKKYRQHVNDPCIVKLLGNVKPWVEDISRVKCKFPWNDDYTVDRNFLLKLVCLDPARKGWLTEEVFIPINETGEHWCLAQFHILSGEVTFYDSEYTYDYDYRDWFYEDN
ncbi:phospholipase-like protein [Tanacetum coccineum]